MLIGIVKKNGIMLINFALHEEREQGLSQGKFGRASSVGGTSRPSAGWRP